MEASTSATTKNEAATLSSGRYMINGTLKKWDKKGRFNEQTECNVPLIAAIIRVIGNLKPYRSIIAINLVYFLKQHWQAVDERERFADKRVEVFLLTPSLSLPVQSHCSYNWDILEYFLL